MTSRLPNVRAAMRSQRCHLEGEIVHEYGIEAFAISSDKRLMAVGGGGGYRTGDPNEQPVAELVIWDIKTRKKVATLTGHTRTVWSVAFSPDNKVLASGSADKSVRLWDVATGKELAVLKDSPCGLFSVVFSPDGKRLAGAVWVDLDKRKAKLECSWDGARSGLGGNRRFPALWGLTSHLHTLKVNCSSLRAFSPDGKTRP